MKLSKIIMSLLIVLNPGMVLGTDAFGTSEAELVSLKKLNQHGTAITLSDKELTKCMVGKWTTGRHDYVFRPNGTWQMLPIIKGGTGGKWHIENGRLYDGNPPGRPFLKVESGLLILHNDGGVYPFRYGRIK